MLWQLNLILSHPFRPIRKISIYNNALYRHSNRNRLMDANF